MYKKILIATDGSDLAEKAVEHGLQLASSLGAASIFVTVTELWSALEMSGFAKQANTHAIQDYEDANAKWAATVLKRATERAASTGVVSEARHIGDRSPAEGILETAEAEQCDLIVMASHGRRGIGRMLLGSQTSEVLGHSKIPVLVLR